MTRDEPAFAAAHRDQVEAASRDLATLAARTYHELRRARIPKRLAGAIVRDVVWAAMTGGRPRE